MTKIIVQFLIFNSQPGDFSLNHFFAFEERDNKVIAKDWGGREGKKKEISRIHIHEIFVFTKDKLSTVFRRNYSKICQSRNSEDSARIALRNTFVYVFLKKAHSQAPEAFRVIFEFETWQMIHGLYAAARIPNPRVCMFELTFFERRKRFLDFTNSFASFFLFFFFSLLILFFLSFISLPPQVFSLTRYGMERGGGGRQLNEIRWTFSIRGGKFWKLHSIGRFKAV